MQNNIQTKKLNNEMVENHSKKWKFQIEIYLIANNVTKFAPSSLSTKTNHLLK